MSTQKKLLDISFQEDLKLDLDWKMKQSKEMGQRDCGLVPEMESHVEEHTAQASLREIRENSLSSTALCLIS